MASFVFFQSVINILPAKGYFFLPHTHFHGFVIASSDNTTNYVLSYATDVIFSEVPLMFIQTICYWFLRKKKSLLLVLEIDIDIYSLDTK